MLQLKLKVVGCFLIALQFASAHRFLHRTLYGFDTNDELSTDSADWLNDAPPDDGYQTFTRDGATLRIKPQQQTIRIGGTNVPPEQMIRQAELMKGLEPVAVRQLLNTKQPVMRTTFENGQKRTSTYILEPDGSILCRTIEDIDPKMVDAEFEKLFQRRKQQQQNESQTKSQTNWEWASVPALAPAPPMQHWPPLQPLPTRASTPSPTPTSTYANTYPKLPQTWNQHTWPQHDPFNPAELPPMPSNSDVDDGFYDPFFTSPFTPTYDTQIPNKVTTTTTTDKDGNTVQTTYTMGPNEWKRKTVKITTQQIAAPSTTTTTTTTPRIPSLEEFLRAQYEATSTTPPPLTSSYVPLRTTTRTPPYEKPVTQLNISDLPLMAVLNNGQPLDEHYLRTYPTELQPLTGDDRQPIKTINIQNIPPTPDQVETTKVRTVTKTLHSDVLPTAADLDPNMLAMLQRAGIKPEDIMAAKGNMITKTRVEPDGRVVKTTYRVRLMPPGENTEPTSYAPSPFESNNSPPPLFKSWHTPSTDTQSNVQFTRPAYFPENASTHHYSSSRSGVQFAPSTTSTSTSTTTTTIKPPHEHEREPLEPAITLNPMHIHPIQQHQPPIALPTNNPISEFLAKIGLTMDDILSQNGDLQKTITNADGRVLRVKFMLIAPPTAPQK